MNWMNVLVWLVTYRDILCYVWQEKVNQKRIILKLR